MVAGVSGKDRGRLIIVRETLDEARSITNGHSTDYRLMKAVWLADLAVEFVLATVVSDLSLTLSLKDKRNPMFVDYLDVISKADSYPELASLRLHFASLRSLHDARNRVHDGLAFTTDKSKTLVGKAESFIQTAFADVYGLDIDRLSLVSFIKPSSARNHLENAEAEIAKRSYSEAMLEVAKALELGRRQFSELLRKKRGSGFWSENLFPSLSRLPRRVSLEEKRIKDIAYFLELSRYGIDIDKAIRYSERVPEVIGFSEEALISASGIVREYSQQEAQEFLDFVADALYRFQTYSDKF